MDMSMDREGYIFDGWYIDPEFTKRINPGGFLPNTVKLYPKWIPKTYPVYYDLEEGLNSPYNPHEIRYHAQITKLYPARAKGRQFVGWFLNGERVEYLGDLEPGPIYLKGIFQDPVSVHLDTQGGAKLSDIVVNLNGYIDRLPKPLRIGYDFVDWYLDPNFIHRYHSDFAFLKPSSLYAKWRLKQYKIEYELDGGVFDEPPIQNYTHLTPTFLLPRASKPGYDFAGWHDERNNRHLMVRKGSIRDHYFKAKWIAKEQEQFFVRQRQKRKS